MELNIPCTSAVITDTASFLPVQSSLSGSIYSGSGGADPVAKRDTLHHSNAHAQRHVVGVGCHVWKPENCVHGTTTVTSTKISTSTVTHTPTTVSTVYAACATNNFADHYSTFEINSISGEENVGNIQNTQSAQDSAYDCKCPTLPTQTDAL